MTTAVPSERIARQRSVGRSPLTPGQKRLWFLEQMVPGTAAYVLFVPILLRGTLDAAALKRALLELTHRHAILRSAFVREADGDPALEHRPFSADELVVEERASFDSPSELNSWMDRHARIPFAIDGGPLFAALFASASANDHALLLKFHHAICDGWSVGIVLAELQALYNAFADGRPSPLAQPSLQFSDYAMALSQGDDIRAEAVRFWTEQFRGVPSLLPLPTDRSRPAVQTFRGASVVHPVEPGLVAAIEEWCAKRRVTPYTAYLCALETLLCRYSGQRTILVGTPVAGRARVELEDVVGFFVNTVVLRADISDETTGGLLADQMRERAFEAMTYQDVPFEQVVDELQVERNVAHNPIFQVLFAYQNTPREPLELRGLACNFGEIANGTSKFDFSLHVTDGEDGATYLLFEYATDLFDVETIERLYGHYVSLLSGLVADDSQRLLELPLLVADEIQYLEGINQTGRLVADVTTWDLVSEQARRNPQGTAVQAADGAASLSYGDLITQVERLGQKLRRHRLPRGTVVAVRLERTPDLIVALLAIFRCGFVYCPIDPELPAERTAFMLDDSHAGLLLTHDETGELVITALTAEMRGLQSSPDDWPTTVSDPAYLIYTSGSTGRPKGVLVGHRGLTNRLEWMRAEYDVTSADRILHKTSISFDVSLWELLLPLVSGAALVLLRPGAHRNMQEVAAELAERRITMTHFVPSVLGAFLELEPLPAFPSLRHIVCSGEALPKAIADTFAERVATRIHNLYGPTEASIDVTAWDCADPSVSASSVPIGRPIWNTRVFVLDALLSRVPIGVSGELYLGGVQLAVGYVGRAGVTAGRFVAAPSWAHMPGERLYRTGDVVRWLRDGTLEYQGRTDDQIKIRGHRIELGEIENALRECDQVADAAVVVIGPPDARRLAAFVVPSRDSVAVANEQSDAVSLQQWGTVWSAVYDNAAPDTRSEIAEWIDGWVDSYTGSPFSAQEMQEYREDVQSLLEGAATETILEVGCGGGHLVQALLPQAREYWATDPSPEALELVRERFDDDARIVVQRLFAHELEDLPTEYFDVVLMASVWQYFPSLEYGHRVVQEAIRRLRPGGRLVIADVRNHDLRRPFYATVAKSRLPADAPPDHLQRAIAAAEESENELMISPAFFLRLPSEIDEIASAEVRLKRGSPNELSKFRFNATLEKRRIVESSDALLVVAREIRYRDEDELWQALRDGGDDVLITNVPNARVLPDLELVAPAVTTVRAPNNGHGVDPERWRKQAAGLGWNMTAWYAGPSYFHAAFGRPSAHVSSPTSDWAHAGPLANEPFSRDVRRAAVRDAARAWAKQVLPEYMVPTLVSVVENLERTNSGKVARGALVAAATTELAMPRHVHQPETRLQRALADIWQDVLGSGPVGVDDNFFELGGDSIRSVRLVNRAAEQGLGLTVRQIFENPTVRQLAAIPNISSHDAESGHLPALPLQAFRLDAGTAGRTKHLLMGPADLEFSRLTAALELLIKHYEGLRVRVEPTNDGYVQRILSTLERASPLDRAANLTTLDDGTIVLEADPLAFDGRSLGILLRLLESTYVALASGRRPELPQPSVSYGDFCGAVQRLVPASARAIEDPALIGTSGRLSKMSLAFAELGVGFGSGPRAHNVTDEHVVVAALCSALDSATRGIELYIARDLRGVVGAALGVDASDLIAAAEEIRRLTVGAPSMQGDVAARIAAAKIAVASADRAEANLGVPHPQGEHSRRVLVSVLAVPGDARESQFLRMLDKADDQGVLTAFDIELRVEVLSESLAATWTFADTIDNVGATRLQQRFVSELGSLGRAVEAGEASFIAADFPLARLDEERLAELSQRFPEAEDVYPLGPFQRHLVDQYRRDERPGLFLVWARYTLEDIDLDVQAFAGAWQEVMRRHATLRTSFLWTASGDPYQIVHRELEIDFGFRDLRTTAEAEQMAEIDAFVAQLERHRTDLERPPLWRLRLFRTGEDRYEFVPQYTYFLQDGWSYWIFIDDLFAYYEGIRGRQHAHRPKQRPFSEHIRYLANTRGDDGPFWRSQLSGARLPTPFVRGRDVGSNTFQYRREGTTLGRRVEAQLRSFARTRHLTMFTLFQAAWAVVVAELASQEDVVIGVVSSGRPPTLPGVEGMTGSFNNIIPVRLPIAKTDDLVEWLRHIQSTTIEVLEHDQSSLGEIREAVGITDDRPLFDSYLVFENFPPGERMSQMRSEWAVGDGGATQTEHPLRLLVWPFGELSVDISYYNSIFSAPEVRQLVDGYVAILDQLSRGGSGVGGLREEARRRLEGLRRGD